MSTPTMNGAEALVKCLEHLSVTHIFGHPGGAAINIFDALVDSSIKFVLARHEQGAAHMADGYARASGKPGVVLVTSGPGALNTVTGLVTARMDSVPMIVISGQTNRGNLGLDAFQEADVFGVTMPLVKHSYLLLDHKDICRVTHEAYHIATTGRPGPVLIDICKDVSGAPTELELDARLDLPGYEATFVADKLNLEQKKDVINMAALINQSRRPLLLVGHGAVLSNAAGEVRTLAEKLQAPVTNTLLGKGGFPESHRLSLGMLGMHGTAYSNYATTRCDLILSIGSRFDDRINGNNAEFCSMAKKLHIDIDPSEIGKIVQPDASVCGNAKDVLAELIVNVEAQDTKDWLKELDDYREKHPLKISNGGLSASLVVDELYRQSGGKAIVTTDVGQHQMWAAQFFLTDDKDCFLSSGGAGTMGFGMPAAIGAAFAKPEATVIAFVGDGGFQMTQAELATAMLHKLNVKIVILDNECLGMVRQWQELFFESRYSGIDLEGNPDFVKLAESYGMKGFYLKDPAKTESVIRDVLAWDAGPCLLHASVIKEENVFPMIPAGKSARDIVLEKPTVTLEKPTGST